MLPPPNREHQELEGALETWFRNHWCREANRVYHQIALSPWGKWVNNYRVPDIVMLTPDRFHIDQNEYFNGPPNAVVEIRSPNDESTEKLPFYAELGVPEVWIVDRSTKVIELFVLQGKEYKQQSADDDGWLTSEATGVEMCSTGDGKITLRLVEDHSTEKRLP